MIAEEFQIVVEVEGSSRQQRERFISEMCEGIVRAGEGGAEARIAWWTRRPSVMVLFFYGGISGALVGGTVVIVFNYIAHRLL